MIARGYLYRTAVRRLSGQEPTYAANGSPISVRMPPTLPPTEQDT